MYLRGICSFVKKELQFKTLSDTARDESVKTGHGEGSFVVIRGRKEKVGMTGA